MFNTKKVTRLPDLTVCTGILTVVPYPCVRKFMRRQTKGVSTLLGFFSQVHFPASSGHVGVCANDEEVEGDPQRVEGEKLNNSTCCTLPKHVRTGAGTWRYGTYRYIHFYVYYKEMLPSVGTYIQAGNTYGNFFTGTDDNTALYLWAV